MKTCSTCRIEQPLDNFYQLFNKKVNRAYPSGLCKSCNIAYSKQWLLKRDGKAYKRNSSLKHLYGMTLADYNRQFETQQGRCAICQTHQTTLKKPLAVDHSHTTGLIRELLCFKCNLNLSVIENKAFVLLANNYLMKFSGVLND